MIKNWPLSLPSPFSLYTCMHSHIHTYTHIMSTILSRTEKKQLIHTISVTLSFPLIKLFMKSKLYLAKSNLYYFLSLKNTLQTVLKYYLGSSKITSPSWYFTKLHWNFVTGFCQLYWYIINNENYVLITFISSFLRTEIGM